MTQQEQIVKYAMTQVGYKETPNNKTKYSEEIDKNYPDFYNGIKNGYAAWCDIFVDYCFLHEFGEEKALEMLCQPRKSAGAGCKYSAQYYKQAGRWFTEPKAGDQIFYFVNGDINHTGIVTKVDANKVYTVEGNSEDAVKTHAYSLDNKKIAGYGRPKYDEQIDAIMSDIKPVNDPIPEKKSLTDIVNEVLSGKWGNGQDRKDRLTAAGYDYDEVQKAVNKAMGANKPTVAEKPSTFIGKVVTKAAPLNIRKGAGMSYAVVGRLPKGSTIELYSTRIGNWYKLIDGRGYVSSQYIIRA